MSLTLKDRQLPEEDDSDDFNAVELVERTVTSLIAPTPKGTYSESQLSEIFPDSTHQYVIFPDDLSDILLGILVIVIQYGLYSVIMSFAMDQYLKDNVPVQVDMYDICKKNDGRNLPLDAMTCEYQLPDYKWLLLVASMLLPAIFLQNDYLTCIRIWCYEPTIGFWGKFMAFAIFFEALLASLTCSLLAYNAVWMPDGSYNAIMDTIGVLFIHDIDEKLYQAAGVINKQHKNKCACCKKFFRRYVTWIFLTIAVVITAFIMPKAIWDPVYWSYNHAHYGGDR